MSEIKTSEKLSVDLIIYYDDRFIGHTCAYIPDIGSEIYVDNYACQFKVINITIHRKHYEIDVELVKEFVS